jgi:uncharacterized membrane protein YkvA (DUF1232 family)
MFTDFKDFYDVLRENLDSYNDSYDEFIDFGPDLFKLLSDLLDESEIKTVHRLKINAAISYYVIPYDIIPEAEYGPNGYVDDIYICVHVINEIANDLGFELLEELWEGQKDFKKTLKICEEESLKKVEHLKEKMLRYVGLIENS